MLFSETKFQHSYWENSLRPILQKLAIFLYYHLLCLTAKSVTFPKQFRYLIQTPVNDSHLTMYPELNI